MEGIETQMLESLDLKPEMLYRNLWKYKPPSQNIEDRWKVPQNGFIKLNYGGASKGNPGQAGARGIFRNSRGEVCRVYALDLGYATNNEAKLTTVKQGLLIEKRENYQ